LPRSLPCIAIVAAFLPKEDVPDAGMTFAPHPTGALNAERFQSLARYDRERGDFPAKAGIFTNRGRT
jgi:hypothetical protein